MEPTGKEKEGGGESQGTAQHRQERWVDVRTTCNNCCPGEKETEAGD